MMEHKKEVKVGDKVSTWSLFLPEYDGCEFKALVGQPKVQITKVPDPKPEVHDEPMTRGSVVTIEGDDEFIAVRFTDADELPYPFVGSYSDTGDESLFGWDEIVYRAEGRKIIVHKTVDPTEAPLAVETYGEWLGAPAEGRKKYKWRDRDGDIWRYDTSWYAFVSEGKDFGKVFGIKNYFPLIRDEKIG